MNNEVIILAGYDGQLSATQLARNERDGLLQIVAEITTVSNTETAERCVTAIKSLKTFSARVEADRKAVKKPVDELAAKIQTLARELNGKIEVELERLQLFHQGRCSLLTD